MGLKAARGFDPANVALTGGSITTVTGVPYILAQSGSGVNAPGDTNENILATVTVPANALGAAGAIRLRYQMTTTNNANAKTLRVRYSGIGGTVYQQFDLVSSASFMGELIIQNRTAGTQVGATASSVPNTKNGSAATTSSVDTTASTTIVITVSKATAGDTVTLESYLAELIRLS